MCKYILGENFRPNATFNSMILYKILCHVKRCSMRPSFVVDQAVVRQISLPAITGAAC
jgi:hypothetical protein